jgi:hypothetical protein
VSSHPGEPLDLDRALGGGHRLERHTDGDWYVRPVAGPAASKAYRCPGCDHEVPPGVAHVVAWPADDLLGDASAALDRRHWHRPCWVARGRRGPRPGRSPRY